MPVCLPRQPLVILRQGLDEHRHVGAVGLLVVEAELLHDRLARPMIERAASNRPTSLRGHQILVRQIAWTRPVDWTGGITRIARQRAEHRLHRSGPQSAIAGDCLAMTCAAPARRRPRGRARARASCRAAAWRTPPAWARRAAGVRRHRHDDRPPPRTRLPAAREARGRGDRSTALSALVWIRRARAELDLAPNEQFVAQEQASDTVCSGSDYFLEPPSLIEGHRQFDLGLDPGFSRSLEGAAVARPGAGLSRRPCRPDRGRGDPLLRASQRCAGPEPASGPGSQLIHLKRAACSRW